MQSLYLTTASVGNSQSGLLPDPAETAHESGWRRIPVRFFTLLLPALAGSMAVNALLHTLAPETPLPVPTTAVAQPASLQPPAAPAPSPAPGTGQPPESSSGPRRAFAMQVTPGRQELLPSLAALDGLFSPHATRMAKPVVAKTARNGNTLPPTMENRARRPDPTPLENEVNATLLQHMDPFTLSREQKQILISSIPTGHPVEFSRINSPFGYRTHPTLHGTRFHPGVDLEARMNTPVQATADGVVEFAGVDNTNKNGLSGFGQVILIQHNFGFSTSYSHLNKIQIKPGDFVKKGDIIGLTGNSGIVTAPHLHYEIRFVNRFLNPDPFMHSTPERYVALFQEKNVQWHALIELIGLRLPRQGAGPMRVAQVD